MTLLTSEENLRKLGAILNSRSSPLHERFRALFTLRNLGGDLAVELIGQCFTDDSALLKHELAYVLGQMLNPAAVPILTRVLEDEEENVMVRHEAAEALGAISLPGSTEVLERYQNDKSEVIAETCQIALDRIRYQQAEQENPSEVDPNPFASVDPAPPCKKDTAEQLLHKMMDKESSLFERYRAMFALRNKADEESVLALTKGLKDSSALFRHEIAYVLGQLSHPASVPALIESLQDASEHEMVRHECAEALGSVATPEVLPVLKKFQADSQRVVKESCDVALDMYEYENSDQFQYADGLAKIH